MFTIEVSGVINIIILVYRIFGLWDADYEMKNFSKRKLFSLIITGSFVTSIVVRAINSDVKGEYIYSAAVALLETVQFVRLVYIIWNKKEIFEFIHQSGCNTIEDFEEFTRVNYKIKKFTKRVTCFLLMLVASAIVAPVSYAVSGAKKFPIDLAIPFDWKNNEIGYCSVFTLYFVAILYSSVILSLNAIIWYILLNFSIKYELLGRDLRRLGVKIETEMKRTTLSTSIAGKEDLYSEDLIVAIKNHQNLRETIEKFRSCFSNLFFLQMTTSGACICGSVYSLAFSYHSDFIQTFVYCVVLLYCVFDIFMIMYLGNEVEDASNRLSYCLYESNWIEQSKSCKNSMIIFTEILKQPHQLVIFVLYPLNLVTFLSIINLAYNMFNILKNLN